jgi:prepilin signal peptidase PulO-like enzyme (type II secretory pathway)
LLLLTLAVYYRYNRNAEYVFAQLITGVIVFMICAMLRWVKLELGLVLGLFAIFSMIRFRTLNIPVKEMAYLFMSVGVSAINAILQPDQCLPWIVFANLFMVLLAYVLEQVFFRNKLNRRTISYGSTDLLKPSRHNQLLQELRDLTELDIVRFEIGKVDYIKKHAQIRIFFKGNASQSFTEETMGNDDD